MGAFVYNTVRPVNTPKEGTISGSYVFTQSDAMSNHERLLDMDISLSVSSWDENDGVLFADGNTRSADYIMTHSTDRSSPPTISVLYGDDINNLSLAGSVTGVADGFKGDSFSSQSGKIWVAYRSNSSGTLDTVTELFIGKRIQYGGSNGNSPAISQTFGAEHGIVINESLGGQITGKQRYSSKKTFQLSFPNVDATFKSNMEDMKDACNGSMIPFYWSDVDVGVAAAYVRMTDDSLNFQEVSYQRYATTLTMREV